MKIIFDAEANGLLKEATRCWIIVAYFVETKTFKEYLEGDLSWIDDFNEADELIGQNILDYDLPLFEKLFNVKFKAKFTDLLIYSKILNYYRFDNRGHSLLAWGEFFGEPKIFYEDWSQFSEEMRKRCHKDVEITILQHNRLMYEFERVHSKRPQIEYFIEAEHYHQMWVTRAEKEGWPFDKEKALVLKEKLDSFVSEIYNKLNDRLGSRSVAVDMVKGVVEVKRPKWTMDGLYHQHICKWFDVHPASGLEDRPIEGPYCRVTFRPLSLDSSNDVKLFLFRHGWEPVEWNMRKDANGVKRKTSPKITEENLELLGGDGVLYREYLSAKSRLGILNGWLENVDENNRLHGRSIIVGTPSMRARHEIIANIVSVDAPWGREMRELFTCLPGWKIVGADSSGNQARALAHSLEDPEFIDVILNKDIHTYNQEILQKVVDSIASDITVTRAQAKRVLYAFLFGGSGAKLWSYITRSFEVGKGNKLKRGFVEGVPGFKKLIDKLKKVYKVTSERGKGYVPSIAGNRIYVDQEYKLLVYYLQAIEEITCATALMFAMKEFEEKGIPYVPLVKYHDEFQVMTPKEYAEEVAEISARSYKEGPKVYGIEIMDGNSKIGNNWAETH